jgi:putative DNA primase/helicase
VQQLAGLSLTGITREQVFVVLHGPPATGKSRFIEIFRHVLADYARALPSDLLLQRQNGPDEERKMAKLLGVRFAAASETEAGGVLDENLVKQLTGEDGVSGRFLYGESFDFMPEAKVWLRTNNPPHVRGADGAVWRRLVSVPFGHEVPPGKIDRDLPEKLKAEADGVLAWAVEGYRDYAEGGLYRARAVEESAAEYRRDESAVERFLESKCILEPTARCGRDELFRAFEAWLRERKWRAWRAGDFKRALLATGKAREVQVRIEGSLQRVWAGLRLRTMEDVKAEMRKGSTNA